MIIAEQFHFHQRSQTVGESINEYVAELRRLTTHCQFGGFLDEVLHDCGLRNEAIQKKLLTEANLTLTRAVELFVGMEAAEKNAKSLKGTENAVKIKLLHSANHAIIVEGHHMTRRIANFETPSATTVGSKDILHQFVDRLTNDRINVISQHQQ